MPLLPSSPAAGSSAVSHSSLSSPPSSSRSAEVTACCSCPPAAAVAAAVFLTPAAAAVPSTGAHAAAWQAAVSAAIASAPADPRPAAAAAAAAFSAPRGGSAVVAQEALLPASVAANAASPAAATSAKPEVISSSCTLSEELATAATSCGAHHHSGTCPSAGAGAAPAERCAAGHVGRRTSGCCCLRSSAQCTHRIVTPCSHTAGDVRAAAARTTHPRRNCRSNNYVGGIPAWEYVFLRRVGLRDHLQSTWFRPVFAAYAAAQAENRRLLAANASAVAIAAASTAVATGANDIAAAAAAAARGSSPVSTSTRGGGAAAVVAGTAATPAARRGAAAAVKQSAAPAPIRDGAARQTPFVTLFPAAGEAAAGTSSSAAAAALQKQEAARRSPAAGGPAAAADPTALGNLNSSSFSAASLARHFRRVGAVRGAGSSHSVVQTGIARSDSSLRSTGSRLMGAVTAGEKNKDEAVGTLVGSRDALQLQFLLQQEVQQQLQQQQMQQLRLLASSSLSVLSGLLTSSGSSREGSAAGAAEAAAGEGGGEVNEPGDFAAAAAAVLQQQHENSLAVQLLQQQVEQLQRQLEEKTGESGVLRRLVAEREEELKEKEKEVAESKKACSLLQSERKHLSKALRAAQQDGMEKALENERYLRELLRHKEAEAVRLNEVQQLYVSLVHQQQQQQLAPLRPEEVDEAGRQQQDETQQQVDEETQQALQQHEEASLETTGRSAHRRVAEGTTAPSRGSGSDGGLLLEDLHQHGAAGAATAAAEGSAAAAVVQDRTSLENAVATRLAESDAAVAHPEEAFQSAAPEQQQQQGTESTHVAIAAGTEGPEADASAVGLLRKNQSGRMQWLDVAAESRVQGNEGATCESGNTEDSIYPRKTGEGVGETTAAAARAWPPPERPAVGPSPLLRDSLRAAGAAGGAAAADASAADGSASGFPTRIRRTVPSAAISAGASSTSGASSWEPAAPSSTSTTATLPSAAACASSAKGSVAASSRGSSQKGGAAGAVAAVAAETPSRNSSIRPSVVNPLLQLLSLSPSWARGAGRTVLRGSPGSRPAAAIPGSSSTSGVRTGALKAAGAGAQVASAGARAGAAAAPFGVTKHLSSGGAARLAAFETAAAEEDEEWGVVGYSSNGQHSDGERHLLQPSDGSRNRRGSITSAGVADSVACGSSAAAAAVPAARNVSPVRALSASSAGPAASTFAEHAVPVVAPPVGATGTREQSDSAAAVASERRTEGSVSPSEAGIAKPLAYPSSAPSSAPSAAASHRSLPATADSADAALMTAAVDPEVAGAAASSLSDDRTVVTQSTSTAAATVLPLVAASAPAAAAAASKSSDAGLGGATPPDGSVRTPSLPTVLSTLLHTAAAAAPPPTLAAAGTSAETAAVRPAVGSPGPAAAAAAVVAAFARPAAELPVAGCFREGVFPHPRGRREAVTAAAGGGGDAFISPSHSRVAVQPPMRVRQRLLAHQGPVHACCAVPRLWSFQLLDICSKPSSSSSASGYSFRSSPSSHRGRRQLAYADLWGGQGRGRAADYEVDEEVEEDAAAAGATERGEESKSNPTAGAYGQSNDFVLTCGQDGFLALVDATRGYLAYSFLVSPFKSPLLCVDAAADRPLAVVAAADVSIYTVDTLNQRVVSSLKGHSGRITACGFLRAAAAADVCMPPSSPSSSSSSVSSSSGSSSAAAAAGDDKQHAGGEDASRGVATSVPVGLCGTATAAADPSPSTSASVHPTSNRSCSSLACGSSGCPPVAEITTSERGNAFSGATGSVADKSRGLSSLSSSSSAFSFSSSGAGAGAGGGSRRGVPRALERLVSRALRGVGGEGSATLWSGGLDRTVRFWDVERSACVKTTKLPSAVTFAAASPCGEWLAAAHQSGAVSLINARAEMGEKITTLQLHDGEPAVGLAFHPSGQWLVSVGKDKQVRVVDVRNCREVYALLHIEMRYNVVQAAPSFSPDGNYVVAAAGPHVFCWSLAEERLRARTRLLQQRAAAAADSAAADELGGLGVEGTSRARGLQEQWPTHGRQQVNYQGAAAKRQQALQFSRGWAHRSRAEALQELRNSNYRVTAHELFAAAEDWQPPVSMHSQSSEIMCLDWQLQHLVTGNRDGSVCFWE